MPTRVLRRLALGSDGGPGMRVTSVWAGSRQVCGVGLVAGVAVVAVRALGEDPVGGRSTVPEGLDMAAGLRVLEGEALETGQAVGRSDESRGSERPLVLGVVATELSAGALVLPATRAGAGSPADGARLEFCQEGGSRRLDRD